MFSNVDWRFAARTFAKLMLIEIVMIMVTLAATIPRPSFWLMHAAISTFYIVLALVGGYLRGRHLAKSK